MATATEITSKEHVMDAGIHTPTTFTTRTTAMRRVVRVALLVGAITLGPGRTSIMQGAVQLVVFAAFLFLSLVP